MKALLDLKHGTCKGCVVNTASVVFFPCQHICLCEACHIRLFVNVPHPHQCPLCSHVVADAVLARWN